MGRLNVDRSLPKVNGNRKCAVFPIVAGDGNDMCCGDHGAVRNRHKDRQF